MKQSIIIAALCGCLMIGSLYPKLLLDHHVKLVDCKGEEIMMEDGYEETIPLKIEFRFLKIFYR